MTEEKKAMERIEKQRRWAAEEIQKYQEEEERKAKSNGSIETSMSPVFFAAF